MNNPEVRIPEDIATEVLTLASRYYAGSTQSYSYQVAFIRSTFIFSASPRPRVCVSVSTTMFERNFVSVSELVQAEAGSEVQIPAEFIEQAIQEIQEN